jgi:hypothetical protein
VAAKELDSGQSAVKRGTGESNRSADGGSQGDSLKMNLTIGKELRDLISINSLNVRIRRIIHVKVVPEDRAVLI